MVTNQKRERIFKSILPAMMLCTQAMFSIAQTSPTVLWLDYQQSEAKPGAVIKYSEEISGTTDPREVKLYTYPAHKLVCTYYYSDYSRKIKEGPYLKYYSNGALSDSGYYRSNRKYGLYKEWHENGQLKSVYHYSFDVAVDTCIGWYENGKLSMQMFCDENGNGIRTEYHQNGNTKGVGKIRNGQPHQRWKYYRENGTALMDVSFYEGESVSTTCFDEKGNEYSKNCYYSSPPLFDGGNAAWMQFIKDHLVYPTEAKQKSIAGIVRVYFDIDASGNLGNFDVVYSPDPILSAEVIRLLKSSPKWIPATHLNQPITYRNKQEIFFQEFE